MALRLAKTARTLRRERGWTLDDVAERSGLDPRHVQLVESGTANPTLATLVRLAVGLGIPLEQMVGEPSARPRVADEAPRQLAGAPGQGAAACAHQVKVARLARGWSQSELARKVGLSLSAVQGLELGRTSPTVRTLDAIADTLGVQTWTLLVPASGPVTTSRTRVSRRVVE